MKPTDDELAQAKKLGIEGARHMTGPELRRAIRRERVRLTSLRQGQEEYQKWIAICRALGGVIGTGRQAPTLKDLKQFYAQHLPIELARRGIVEGSRIVIPPESRLMRKGEAVVGALWPMNSEDRIALTLGFGGKPYVHDAWLVWRDATNIRPPKGYRFVE